MEADFLKRLSPDIASIADAIETAAGITIDVVIQPERVVMACDIDQHGAKLLTPSREYFRDGPVLHELLHMRRIVVERVPKVIDCDDCDGISPETISALVALDNTIEHLAIVPEELSIRAERRDYWENRFAIALEKLERASFSQDDTKRWTILNSLFAEVALPGSPSTERLRHLEHEFSATQEAVDFRATIRPIIGEKERAVIEVFRLLKLPPNIASFEYLDIGTGNSPGGHPNSPSDGHFKFPQLSA